MQIWEMVIGGITAMLMLAYLFAALFIPILQRWCEKRRAEIKAQQEALQKRAMWLHLDEVCSNGDAFGYVHKLFPLKGMCVIKAFEDVNKIKFDVFNDHHRNATSHQRAQIACIHINWRLERLKEKSAMKTCQG